MINRKRLVDEFMEMVRVDSESKREGRMSALLMEKLEHLGFAVYVDDAGPKTGSDTGNLIARLSGNAEAPAIMFSAHMDTVSPGRGINPVEENGLIRSDGTTVLGADDKAGIAAVLEAVRVTVEQKMPHGDLELVFTVCEEVGLSGAKFLDFSRLTARMGYVLDSNGPAGTIINLGPSQDEIYAEMLGVAAHAGINPEDGVNAVQVASRAIANMRLGRIDQETTANIGIISGGVAINIVPDKVMIKGETRSLREEKRIKQSRAICDALEQAAREGGAQVQVNVETVYPAMAVPVDAPVVQLAEKAALAIGLKPVVKDTGGGSDTHIFNENGISAVNLGIAMQKVHTIDEFITVRDLVLDASYVLSIINTTVRSAAGREHGYFD